MAQAGGCQQGWPSGGEERPVEGKRVGYADSVAWMAASGNHMGSAPAQGPDASSEAGVGGAGRGGVREEELGKMFQT